MSKRKRTARKASRAISGCLVVIVLIVIAALFNNSPKKSTGSSTSAPPTRATERATGAATAQPVRAATAQPQPTATRFVDTLFVRFDAVRKFYINSTTAIDGLQCPQEDCPVSTHLLARSTVYVEGLTQGEKVNGNVTWYRTSYGGQVVYIHSSLLTDALPGTIVAQQPTSTITDTPAAGEAGATDASFFRYAAVRTMYVSKSSSVNARTCPRTTCSIVTRLSGFSAVPVEGEVTGELVTNNTLWYQITTSGQTAYVHSSLLSTEKPATPLPRPTQPPIQFVATLPPDLVISTPIPIQPPIITDGGWTPVCSGNVYNCPDLTCDQLAAYIATCAGDPSDLDGDKNGSYCVSKHC